MIPELDDGVLAEGIHDCTIDEIEQKFSYFGKTDQRTRLTTKLREFVSEARQTGFVTAIIVDGSYVTNKKEPNDIDILVCLDLK